MKTKLAIAALALTMSAPAMAFNPEGNVGLCESIREAAELDMELRQIGSSIETALSAPNDITSAIAVKAYTYPIFPNTTAKAKAIEAFGGYMFLTCMAGGMEFDENNQMSFVDNG